MNLSLDQSEGSLLSDDFLDTPDDLDINVDDIETPDETDSLEFITNGNDLEWEGKSCASSLLHDSHSVMQILYMGYTNDFQMIHRLLQPNLPPLRATLKMAWTGPVSTAVCGGP